MGKIEMTSIIPFLFDGREVRTLMIDGQPWFVATDLCALLDLTDTRKSIGTLRSKDRKKFPILSKGGDQLTWIVSEPGMYRLVLRSNKPDAERVQDWICDEVLPSIRKTGKFQVDVHGWLSSGPKPWTKRFPDRFYQEIFRLWGKPIDRLKEQEPWLGQLTKFLIYYRIEQGVPETLNRVNPVPVGKRWRARKHHQHIAPGEPERQFQHLLGECVGMLIMAKTWDEFLATWNVLHPLVALLPQSVEAELSDGQLELFSLLSPRTQPQ